MWSNRVAAALLLLLAAGPAAAGEMRCPDAHGGKPLANVSVFDGPLSEQADLVPDSYRVKNGRATSTWSVGYIFRAGRQLYVRCDYGKGIDPVVIAPKTPGQCSFMTSDGRNSAFACH